MASDASTCSSSPRSDVARRLQPHPHHLLVNELDNVRNRVYVLTRGGGKWTREPLPGMPDFGTVSADAVDGEESDDFFMTATDYLAPTSLSIGTVGKGAPESSSSCPPSSTPRVSR